MSMPDPNGGHSMFGGSAMHRVIACPGSAMLCALIPEPPSSDYALDGSAVHEIAAAVLKEMGTTSAAHVGAVLPTGHIFNEEDARHLDVYIQACHELASRPGMMFWVEEKFCCSDIDSEVRGTCDFLAYDPNTRLLHVYDLKWGAGKYVPAENNPQLLTYACGALRALKGHVVEHVTATIVQPRHVTSNSPVRWAEYSFMDLLEWQETVLRPAVVRARRETGTFVLGSHCHWCRGAIKCPAMQAKRQATAGEGFGAVAQRIEEIGSKTDRAVMRAMLDDCEALEIWCERVREHCKQQAIAGNVPVGFELKPHHGPRKWTDEAAAEDAISKSGINPFALASVTEIERRFSQAPVGKAGLTNLSHLIGKTISQKLSRQTRNTGFNAVTKKEQE